MTNASGLITNYVAVKRDVTREVRLQKQLRQFVESANGPIFGVGADGFGHGGSLLGDGGPRTREPGSAHRHRIRRAR